MLRPVLYCRDQVELPEDQTNLEVMPSDDFKYKVPIYLQELPSYLRQTSLCPPAKGYPMAMTPVEYIAPEITKRRYPCTRRRRRWTRSRTMAWRSAETHPGGEHSKAMVKIGSRPDPAGAQIAVTPPVSSKIRPPVLEARRRRPQKMGCQPPPAGML